jgi:hypothetical protein
MIAKNPYRLKLNIRLLMLIFSMLLAGNLTAQKAPAVYKIDLLNCPKVTIANPGSLLSTYTFSEEEEEKFRSEMNAVRALKTGKFNAVVDQIVLAHTEEYYPESAQSLNERTANPAIIKGYYAYRVAEIGDKSILVIPAKYNKNQPKGWAPANDFYMIIETSGIN